MKLQIDIVLPCYNPGNQWTLELISFFNFAKEKYSLQFIIVNDGTQGKKIAQQIDELKQINIPVSLYEYPVNRGKGYALRLGVSKTQSPIVVYTDIDFPFTNQSMLDVIHELEKEQFDVVVGNRNETYYQKKMSWFRKYLSQSFRYFIKRFLNMQISDTQCGLKGFREKGKKKFLETTIDRYLFDFEFIYNISNANELSLKAVEVSLKENVSFRKMKLSILSQEAFNLLRILLRLK